MRIRLILFLMCFSAIAWSQGTLNPAAYYPLDNCTLADSSGNQNDGTIIGNPQCRCGVFGQSLRLDGVDDGFDFPSAIDTFFTGDFSFSFYFKPLGGSEIQYLWIKEESCNAIPSLRITYDPNPRVLRVELYQNFQVNEIIETSLPPNQCWYHVALVRAQRNISLFVDGERDQLINANAVIDFSNDSTLMFANSPCLPNNGTRYRGYIDEISIYDRALTFEEVQQIYTPVNRLITQDTLIFEGDGFQVRTYDGCASMYQWTPANGVMSPMDAEPFLSPTETTTYSIEISEDECTIMDTLIVRVVNPDSIACSDLRLPTAFTPNNDGLNDVYGISNPYLMDELISFEILDRTGATIFETSDPDEQWDGAVRGTPVNPGVFVYRIRYECEGDEYTKAGSFTVLR